ncbi:MAG: FKBP-type peptidyl-prolyl cis-trans isomerase [Elusimicrobiaceae bacterium]|jgi:FKBP-type peptidyl-prolyl cis-trans isomerase FkpA
MKKVLLVACVVALAGSFAAAQDMSTATVPAPAESADTEKANTFYTLGFVMGEGLKNFSVTADEMKLIAPGIQDAALGEKARIDTKTYMPKLEAMAHERMAAKAEVEKKKSGDYLAKMKAETKAVTLPSGIIMISVADGTGAYPAATDTVEVKYRGTLTDGTVFDDSSRVDYPVKFPLSRVIPCWTEGIQKIKKGGKAKLVCPSDTAYGDMGMPPVIPGGATLTFDVELVDIAKPEPAEKKTAAPAEVKKGKPQPAVKKDKKA